MGSKSRLAGCGHCRHDGLFPGCRASRNQERSACGSDQSTTVDQSLNLMIGETDFAGLVKRDNTVLQLCNRCQIPIRIHPRTMPGGYDKPQNPVLA
jgi:hypothetical protein